MVRVAAQKGALRVLKSSCAFSHLVCVLLLLRVCSFLINVRSSSSPKEGSAGLPHLLSQLRSRQAELNQLLQPIPPSLASLGLELLTLPGGATAGRRGAAGSAAVVKASSVKNSIITVDARNLNATDSLDASIDLSTAVRVSNRILSSPDHETSGHWGFDLIAPLIGSLCAFCNWSQNEGGADGATRGGSSSSLGDAANIRMLAVQCLGEIGAVDPYAINGHNSRVFRNANPLPPIGKPLPLDVGDAPHPFAAALLSAPSSPASSASAAAQLHASWYGRSYAVGGGLQASSCEILSTRSKDPQAFSNEPHHVLILYLLNQYWRSSNAHVAQIASHALVNLFSDQKEATTAAAAKGKPAAAGAAAAAAPAVESDNGVHPPSSHAKMVIAFSQLDNMTQSYLSPFWAAKLKSFRPLLRTRSREETESQVWDATANGGQFDDWICKLARFLLSKRVKDPVLIHCAGVAQHLPDLATRLFPYILFDMLAQGDAAVQQMLALRVNSLVASILATPQQRGSTSPAPTLPGVSSSSTSPSLSSNSRAVLQVLLAALQYVREQCLIIHRQVVHPATKNHTAPPREGIDLVRNIAAHWDAKLDLIKIAQAAQACESVTTNKRMFAVALCCSRFSRCFVFFVWFALLQHVRDESDSAGAMARAHLRPSERHVDRG